MLLVTKRTTSATKAIRDRDRFMMVFPAQEQFEIVVREDTIFHFEAFSRASGPCVKCCRSLLAVQLRVQPIQSQQLVVTSALYNASLIEHEDQIGISNRRQAVRNDERRAFLENDIEHRLDDSLIRRIER